MQKQPSFESRPSVLLPTTPTDIGERSQRARIIAAMIDSCAEKTYAATTISDIVARARISRTTFYKRFADKRDCFDAAVAFCLDELRAAASGAHAPGDAPADATRMATISVLARMAAEPAMAQLLTGDAVGVEPLTVERYRQQAIPAIEALWPTAEGRGTGGPAVAGIDPRLAFSRAQLLVFNEIAAGRAGELLALRPEIVYLAVAPFGGHDEAVRQAQIAERDLDRAGGT